MFDELAARVWPLGDISKISKRRTAQPNIARVRATVDLRCVARSCLGCRLSRGDRGGPDSHRLDIGRLFELRSLCGPPGLGRMVRRADERVEFERHTVA